MGWRDAARTDVAAVAQRVAAERAGFAGDEAHALGAGFVARIHHEIQGPVKRHRTEITRVEGDERAGRVARAAINALRLMLHRLPFRAVSRNGIKIILIQILARDEVRQDPLIGIEERFQIYGQIADDRQIAQRLNAEFIADRLDESAASEAFAAIDDHRARAAHADAAGEAEGEVRAGAALQGEDRIED